MKKATHISWIYRILILCAMTGLLFFIPPTIILIGGLILAWNTAYYGELIILAFMVDMMNYIGVGFGLWYTIGACCALVLIEIVQKNIMGDAKQYV